MFAVFKWTIENYGHRLRSAVYGDEWTSDVFTLKGENSPQCYWTFRPPVERVEYSPVECPFLPKATQDNSIFLTFLKSPPTSFNAKIWAEDCMSRNFNPTSYNSQMLYQDGYGHCSTTNQASECGPNFSFETDFLKSWNKNSLAICCQYEVTPYVHPNQSACMLPAGPYHQNSPQLTETRLVVDCCAPPTEFRFDASNGTQLKKFEFDGKRVQLESKIVPSLDSNSISYTVQWKNLGAQSDELFHYEAWMENESGHRTYKIEGIKSLMESEEVQTLWRENVTKEDKRRFFGDPPACFCLNLRPLCSWTQDANWKNDQQGSELFSFLAKNGNDEKFGDVKIECKDGKKLYANKLILCAFSPIFWSKFKHADTIESQTKTIKLDDLDSELVASMLEFMHTGRVKNMKQVDAALYVIADRYELTGLLESCLKSMSENFSPNTILDCLKLAFNGKTLPDFKSRAIAYATQNLDAIISLDQWSRFGAENMSIINELLRAQRAMPGSSMPIQMPQGQSAMVLSRLQAQLSMPQSGQRSRRRTGQRRAADEERPSSRPSD